MFKNISLPGPVLVFLGGTCLGFAPIGLRLGLGDLGPQAIALWRYLFALPVLLGLVFLIERRAPKRPNKFVVMAGLFFAGDMALWHVGLSITTVANATFIVNLGNITAGFLAWVFLKDRLSPMWFAAIALALIGAAALTFGGGAAGKGVLRGDLLALGAAMFLACYLICAKVARRDLGGIETIFWLTCVEALAGTIIVGVSGEAYFPKSAGGFQAPLFLALIVQVAGQGLIITGLGRTPASTAGVLILVQPVVAAGIAWSLFDEPLTALQLGGAGLILFGIWLAQKRLRSSSHETAS